MRLKGNQNAFVQIHNSIIWGNEAGGVGAQIRSEIPGGNVVSRYSDVQRLDSDDVVGTVDFAGTGNIGDDPADDPLFVGPGAEPWEDVEYFALGAGSPCIDAGDNGLIPLDEADADEDGNTSERLPIDLTGYARRLDDPDTDDTGDPGTLETPVVDMGAREFAYAALDPPGPEPEQCDPPSSECVQNSSKCMCKNSDSCVDGVCICGQDSDCRAASTCIGEACYPTCVEGVCVVPKDRYISFVPRNPGVYTALRVTLVGTGQTGDFQCAVGRQWWVGAASDVSELSGRDYPSPPNFKAATLECAPVYTDWAGMCSGDVCVGGLNAGEGCSDDTDCNPVVHVYAQQIVPGPRPGEQQGNKGSVYAVQAIAEGSSTDSEESYSPPYYVLTTGWGDVVGPPTADSENRWRAPDGVVELTKDAVAILDKFNNKFHAPIKARCDLKGSAANPEVPNRLVDPTDAGCVLFAFEGQPYPWSAPAECTDP